MDTLKEFVADVAAFVLPFLAATAVNVVTHAQQLGGSTCDEAAATTQAK